MYSSLRMIATSSYSRAEASKRFGRYKDEDEKGVRKSESSQGQMMAELIRIWSGYDNSRLGSMRYDHGVEDCYYFVAEQIGKRGLRHSKDDVSKFAAALRMFEDEQHFSPKAGAALSAIVNMGPEDSYELDFSNLSARVDCLGYLNTKGITVRSDIGNNVGWHMTEGRISVHGSAGSYFGGYMLGGQLELDGDAGDSVGSMQNGGEIIVRGNAGNRVAAHMRKGSVSIFGNAGDLVGDCMQSGEVKVHGDVGDDLGCALRSGEIDVKGAAGANIGKYMTGGTIRVGGGIGEISEDFRGGKIIHKGILIADKKHEGF